MHTEEKREAIPNGISRAVFAALGILLQTLWLVNLANRFAKYSVPLQLLSSLIALVLTFRIYGRHINSAYKISWIILLMLFPVFGVCLYFICGRTGAKEMNQKLYRRTNALLAPFFAAGQTLPAGDLPEELRGQCAYLNGVGFPTYQNTDVTFYSDTTQALEAQKEALRRAEKFIFMEYHAIEDSTAWQGIEDILAQRAAAGVEVRVFYDDAGSIGFVNTSFVKKLRSKGIACRVFNPLIPALNVFMNNRDHRKITVVDGVVGFTGGYNLANEYFNLTHPYGQWKDSGLRLEGEAVRSLTLIFLEMWGTTQKEPIDPTPYLPEVTFQAREGALVLPYSDNPLDDTPTGEDAYLNMIRSARQYCYITTPYLILSDEMQRTLSLAAASGVDVRILTPGIPDKKLIYSVTRSYYASLVAKGVRIYEYTPGFLHSKQCLIDDRCAIVGTINLDFRSLYLHFENACWFANCQAVGQVRQDFESLFPQCREVTEDYKGQRTLAIRGKQCLLRLFSPLF